MVPKLSGIDDSVHIDKHHGSNAVASTKELYASTTTARRRKISFALKDQIFEIPHINNMSGEEIRNVWTTRQELKKIRQQCAAIVKVMNSESAAEHGVCFRGLDQNTPSYVAEQMQLRQQLYETVHAIQSFERSTGLSVPTLLSEASQRISSKSVLQAHNVGLLDAHYVKTSVLDSVRRRSRNR